MTVKCKYCDKVMTISEHIGDEVIYECPFCTATYYKEEWTAGDIEEPKEEK